MTPYSDCHPEGSLRPGSGKTSCRGMHQEFWRYAYALAAVGLLGAMYWSQLRMPAANGGSRFQSEMIVALAFAEVPTIAGLLLFFVGRKTTEFWPFAILSVLVQVLFVLPRVIQRD